MNVRQQDHVRADPLGVVRCGRNDRGDIAAGNGFPEPEIRRQHAHAVGQLVGAELDQLLGEGTARAELLRRPALHVVGSTGQHCGQRHSLSDDHQPDDQYEKSFAEAAHGKRL